MLFCCREGFFVSSDIFRSFPVELSIGGIKIIIIDPHNHILPYWFREFLRHRCNLIVVRIDAHHDMFHYCPALPAREGREKFQFLLRLMPYLQDYCREKVNEGNFTCPGFHYGAIGAVYHFSPKENQINAYGRVSGSETIDAPRTAEKRATSGEGKGKWIVWDENSNQLLGSSAKTIPVPRMITLNDFHRDMQEIIKKRLAEVRKVLESMERPQFICLARSQTPRCYIPERIVDRAQKSALGLINEVYG
jgi:hypothetical protein